MTSRNTPKNGYSFSLVFIKARITLYMHTFAQHVHEFLRLYGNIVIFSQQGLKKLNDATTKYYQSATNHQGYQALNEVLEIRNRTELLEEDGYQRSKQVKLVAFVGNPDTTSVHALLVSEITNGCEVQTTEKCTVYGEQVELPAGYDQNEG